MDKPDMTKRLEREEQERFAAAMRGFLPKPAGERYHPPYFIDAFASRVLGRRVEVWRYDLTRAEAARVYRAAEAQAQKEGAA